MLQFTGAKRVNFDRAEFLKKWQPSMEDSARRLLIDVSLGRLTGFLIISATDGHFGSDDLNTLRAGIFAEDGQWTAEVAYDFAHNLRGASVLPSE